MQHKVIQSIGIAWTLLFAVFIIWVYATQPRNLDEVTAGVQAATIGYESDPARFDAALALFHSGDYRAARDEWGRADPGRHDARTQFYIAYAFYREGWHLTHPNEELYQQGLEAVDRAAKLSSDKTLTVDDPKLLMHTAAELKAEIELSKRSAGDSLFGVFRFRK